MSGKKTKATGADKNKKAKKKLKKLYVAPIMTPVGTLTAMPIYASQSNT